MSNNLEFEEDYTVRQVGRGIYSMFPKFDPDFVVAQALDMGTFMVFDYQKDWFLSKEEISAALKFMQSKVPWPSTRKWIVE